MKKLTMFVVVCLGIVLCGTAQANLLLNPGFEEPSPANWFSWGEGGWDSWETNPGTCGGTSHTGEHYVRVGEWGDEEYRFWAQAYTGMTAGEVYTFSTWAKADPEAGFGNVIGSFKVEYKDANWQVLRTDEHIMMEGEGYDTWEQYSFTTGPVPDDTVEIVFALQSTGHCIMNFDDAEVTLVPEPATILILALGGLLLRSRKR